MLELLILILGIWIGKRLSNHKIYLKGYKAGCKAVWKDVYSQQKENKTYEK